MIAFISYCISTIESFHLLEQKFYRNETVYWHCIDINGDCSVLISASCVHIRASYKLNDGTQMYQRTSFSGELCHINCFFRNGKYICIIIFFHFLANGKKLCAMYSGLFSGHAFNDCFQLVKWLRKEESLRRAQQLWRNFDYLFIVLAYVSIVLGPAHNRQDHNRQDHKPYETTTLIFLTSPTWHINYMYTHNSNLFFQFKWNGNHSIRTVVSFTGQCQPFRQNVSNYYNLYLLSTEWIYPKILIKLSTEKNEITPQSKRLPFSIFNGPQCLMFIFPLNLNVQRWI